MIPWEQCGSYTDIHYHKCDGIAKITINRPEVRNAFRPLTVEEMSHALNDARNDPAIGVVILTGRRERGILFRRRSENPRRCRLCRRPGRPSAECPRFPKANPHLPEADHRDDRRLCDRRRPCPSCGMRFEHRGRQRDLWPDRTQSRFFRRRLRQPLSWPAS